MTATIHPFKRSRTKESHDTQRQVSRSETPSGLSEALKHIARAHQPDHFWYHVCKSKKMFNTKLIDGQICKHCGRTKDDVYHNRPDGAV